MNEDRLTEMLAVQVMGWRVAPGRFIKAGRTWIPRWRFAPLTNLEHAFMLLDRTGSDFRLVRSDGTFIAEVRVGARTGEASGEPKVRTITMALTRALGLELPHAGSDAGAGASWKPRPRSQVDAT